MPRIAFKKVAVGTAVAAAAGYVAGILTAPRAGKETREVIRGTAVEKVNNVEAQMHHAQDELKRLIDEANTKRTKLGDKAKQELDDARTLALDARDKAQTVLRAVRRGKADDVQLQRALNDVKAAGKHLKAFLTKSPGKASAKPKTKSTAKRSTRSTSTTRAKSTSRSAKRSTKS